MTLLPPDPDTSAAMRRLLTANQPGTYCYLCLTPDPQRTVTPDSETYNCRTCGSTSDIAFNLDGKAVIDWTGPTPAHINVGVVVGATNPDGSPLTLLFLRRRWPYLYTIPAGHLDQGDTPESGARRELQEETGLAPAGNLTPLFDKPFTDTVGCRRGISVHHWHVHTVTLPEAPQITLSEEGHIIGWYTPTEIRALIGQEKIGEATQISLETALSL